jgi:hypothetical protein
MGVADWMPRSTTCDVSAASARRATLNAWLVRPTGEPGRCAADFGIFGFGPDAGPPRSGFVEPSVVRFSIAWLPLCPVVLTRFSSYDRVAEASGP